MSHALQEPEPSRGIDFTTRPSDAAIAEIEAERTRRMHHRPPNSEVNNTHRVFNSEIGRFEDCEDPIHFQRHHRH